MSLENIKSLPSRVKSNLSAKIDDAKSESQSTAGLCLKLACSFSGYLAWTLCFVCTVIVPAILLVLGLINLDDCADRPCEYSHKLNDWLTTLQ